MHNTHSPLSNRATTSHPITQLMNTGNFKLLTSVHQCISDDVDKLHDEFL